MQSNLFSTLMAIASVHPMGFTIDSQNLSPVVSGYAVAVADTQNSFGRDGLRTVIKYAKKNKSVNAYGGWYDTESGFYYWDAVIVYNNLSDAIKAGRDNKQIAIYDLANNNEIRL